MKKVNKLLVISFILIFSLILTGCTKEVAFTYAVDTGDDIKIKISTNDDYKLSSNVPFTISKDDKTLSTGTFLTAEGYDLYKYNISVESHIKIFEEKEKGEITYTFFSVKDEQFIYLIKVNNSNTGIYLENNNSKEEAKQVFDMLTITLANS